MIVCKREVAGSVNKKRKEWEKEIRELKEEFKYIEPDMATVANHNLLKDDLEKLKREKHNTPEYLKTNIAIIVDLLVEEGFARPEYALTASGFIAANLKEVHCLVFARLLEKGRLDALDTRSIISVMSCFTNVSIQEDLRVLTPPLMVDLMKEIESMYHYYENFELKMRTDTGVNYEIHYDLMDAVLKWTNCECAADCKVVLQELEENKGIFLGEFVKALLKINNISLEMEKIAESRGNIALLSKLKEIPVLTQKYVATNQSLYL
jgi:superfamily II RNA helicase